MVNASPSRPPTITAAALMRLTPVWIVLVVIYAYSNACKGPFLYDDITTIQLSPNNRTLWPLTVPMFPRPDMATAGRPLSGLSFAINYAVGGLDTWGYHATNIVLHALASMVLWGVIRRSLMRLAHPAAEAIAMVTAIVWAVHPLQTDTVTYIINREEGQMGLLALLSAYCLLRAADSLRPARWLVASVIASLASVATKEVGAMLSLILPLFDALVISRSWRELWRSRKLYHAALWLNWILLPLLLATASDVVKAGGGARIAPLNYLMMQSQIIWMYLKLCVWPSPLIISYVDWPVVESFSRVWLEMLSLGAIFLATCYFTFRRKPAAALGVWFFLILAPSSSVWSLASEPAAERRMYLPLAAVLLGGILLIERWTRALPRREVIGAVATGALVLLLGQVTLNRNEDYSSTIAIWTDTIVKRPNNPTAHYNLGLELESQGYLEDALVRIENAMQISPNYADARVAHGQVLVKLHRYDEAGREVRRVLAKNPRHVNALVVLGAVYLNQGNIPDAKTALEFALQCEPGDAEAIRLLAIANQPTTRP